MAIARKEIVDTETPGFYHCTNRCVRRAFLCGIDEVTGKNYEHRKGFIEQRMLDLCEIFSIEIYAYAVMSDHYHIVFYLDPKAPVRWSDAEVAERWINVYPSKLDKPENAALREVRKLSIMDDADKLAICRARLGDLSWYMRRLNEPLAKKSNLEDYVTGRFWEGRFRSQALLDDAAVLSCMTYVDLNPVRARITEKLEESKHTSIKKRLDKITAKENGLDLDSALTAMAGDLKNQSPSITLREYTELTEWAGRSIIHPDKASIPKHIGPILERLNLQKNHWLKQIENYGDNYCHVVGPIELIRHKAAQLKKRYLRGLSSAKLLYFSN